MRILAVVFVVIACAAFSVPAQPELPTLAPLQQMFLFKELRPQTERVGVFVEKGADEQLMKQIRQAAAATQVKVYVAEVVGLSDIAPGFRSLVREHRVDAVWVVTDDGTMASDAARTYLIEQAAKAGVPVLAPTKAWVDAGASVCLVQEGSELRIVLNQAAATLADIDVPSKYSAQTDMV